MSKQDKEIHLTLEQLELVNKELSTIRLCVVIDKAGSIILKSTLSNEVLRVLDRRDCRRIGAMFSILSIGMEE